MAKIKIRTQFLTLFLVIGLIPLFIVEAFYFYQSSKILITSSFEHVSSIQEIRNNDLIETVEHRVSEFNTLLNSDTISRILNIKNSKDKEDIDSIIYKFLEDNSFYNFILLEPNNMDFIYSYKEEGGYYKSSGLSRVFDKATFTNEVVFEDYSNFDLTPDSQSAFFANSIRDDFGKIICVAVIQLTDKFVNTMINSNEGLGLSGESYLINYNKTNDTFDFRSNLVTMGNGQFIIGYRWKSKVLDYWHKAVENGIHGGQGEYIDSAKHNILVKYNKLDIKYFNWYLITKIDRTEVLESLTNILFIVIFISFLLLIVIAVLSLFFSSKLTDPIKKGADFAKDIADGNYNTRLDINRKDEIGLLAKSLKEMGRNLSESAWLRKGREGLDDALRGEHDIKSMGNKFISFVVNHLDAQLGALYLVKECDTKNLYLTSTYAFSNRDGNFNKIAVGEGLVGQAAYEMNEIVYTNVPSDSPQFNFGVSSILPTCYIATPLIFEEELLGVTLIGITVPVTSLQRKFISNIKSNVAILLNSAKASSIIQDLLEDAQVKQEELRVSNEELEQQTEALKESEKELQAQQEELRVTNEELQERTKALEAQREIMKDKNSELEVVGKDLEKKAVELERASRYKSEFLANMSHELRTPLNSILILSQLLSNNKNGNLDDNQIKSATAINSSGEDLLRLINEILDLSKVESGNVELNPEVMTLDSLVEDLKRVYNPTADQKSISFNIELDRELPDSLITDPHRLQQVLRNLLSNAFKFTNKNGSVNFGMIKDNDKIRFDVTDSGIGIKKEKQDVVFEAFKQADGSTSRKYGGTGLGLSISKELVNLLGGEIFLKSDEGKGSTFSVLLPIKEGTTASVKIENDSSNLVEVHVKDDRESVDNSNKTLLIIEDDVNFASILKDQAHDRGFNVLIAEDGETGLHFADYYKPSAIILDIGLPGIDGLAVMARLKKDPELRHIPVHFMSGNEKSIPAMKMGAIGFMMKPVTIDGIKDAFEKLEGIITTSLHKLLIVEDDQLQRESIKALIEGPDVEISAVGSGEEAFKLIKANNYDCVILDLGLHDMSGYELLDKIKQDSDTLRTPIIIYTGRELTKDEEASLKKYTESIIIKGVKSPERLLEETSLFLHRISGEYINNDIEQVSNLKNKEILSGKNILIVDDDMRNIFALSSILEDKDMNVIVAKDGIESLEKLKEHSNLDLILMDIMMPRMDGYEAIRRIRKMKDRSTLPIIALTANAMKGDRNKCIDAGANDYLAKPVDNSKLLSMLRVWLYK